jgi:ribonuclease P protein component
VVEFRCPEVNCRPFNIIMSIHTFSKPERLSSKIAIDELFAGGAKSFSVFPLRVVYLPIAKREGMSSVSLLISVPKKRFKRAVKRNRVKRQIREAYRKHKELLLNAYQNEEQNLMLAVIYLSDRLVDSSEIEEKLATLLVRILDNKE